MIAEAELDATQMTYIFVHGWLGGIQTELWLTQAKNAAMSNNQTQFKPNVIIVDWSYFANKNLYEATRNSLKVSQRLGKLLKQLVEVGKLKPELMHCLGHSIGTHICGQAARAAFKADHSQQLSRFGRITGLDPGGFCYELGIRNESTYLGLRPSDAQLVDAYYSNRSPFGNKYQVAHFNVRLNNGFFQRSCSVWRNPERARDYFRTAIQVLLGRSSDHELITCDHYYATRFAARSSPGNQSADNCSYLAYACDSYRDFRRGKCGLCTNHRQCYPMEFEYQRSSASQLHALNQLASYATSPPGGVAYDQRLTYYMRVDESSAVGLCSKL